MFARHLLVSAALLLVPSSVTFAQSPSAQSPSAKCRDGTLSYSTTRSGTCSGHGGVAEWLAPSDATAKCNDGTFSTSASRQGACSSHGGVAQWLTQTSASATGSRVWVNTSSGVYHCPGSRYYGGTKQGKYMTETEARAAGHRPASNRSCS
jgi:hypothetical protein